MDRFWKTPIQFSSLMETTKIGMPPNIIRSLFVKMQLFPFYIFWAKRWRFHEITWIYFLLLLGFDLRFKSLKLCKNKYLSFQGFNHFLDNKIGLNYHILKLQQNILYKKRSPIFSPFSQYFLANYRFLLFYQMMHRYLTSMHCFSDIKFTILRLKNNFISKIFCW